MSEYIVDFGDEKSSAFVRLAMAQAEANGARLREKIVRCRDCDYGLYDGKTCCRIDPGFDEYWFEVEPDGFCAWACRK